MFKLLLFFNLVRLLTLRHHQFHHHVQIGLCFRDENRFPFQLRKRKIKFQTGVEVFEWYLEQHENSDVEQMRKIYYINCQKCQEVVNPKLIEIELK